MHEVKTIDVDYGLKRAYSFSVMLLTKSNLPTLEDNITQYTESLMRQVNVSRKQTLEKLQPILPKLRWDDWKSGREEFEEVKNSGQWADGSKFGRLHDKPYLHAFYARAIKDRAQQARMRGHSRHSHSMSLTL